MRAARKYIRCNGNETDATPLAVTIAIKMGSQAISHMLIDVREGRKNKKKSSPTKEDWESICEP